MTREQQIDWLCRLKSEIKIFMPYQWQKPFEEALDMAIKALEQEPRKGHWIDTKENSTNTRGQIIHEVICSECNGIAYFRSIGNKYIGANICPNCGADMQEVEE